MNAILDLHVTTTHKYDTQIAPSLIIRNAVEVNVLLGDKGYDDQQIRAMARKNGIRPYDSAVESVDAEITIDTTGCWSRSDNPPSLSLSGGGREWCDVFRVVEDYRSGADFDPHNDRHIEFPSANGWTSRGNIQFERTAVDTANLSKRMTRRAVRQTYWEEARVRIESNEASQEIDLDFGDMNSKMDNSPMFNIR